MLLSISPASQNAVYVTGSGTTQIGSVTLFRNQSSLASATVQFLNTDIPWLFVSLGAFTGNTAIAQIFISDEADLLQGTQYVAKIYFTDESGFPFVHTVNLTKQDPLVLISTDKTNYSVVYNRLTNTLSGETTINVLHNDDDETLMITTNDTLFLEKTGIDSFSLEEDPAFPFATNSELPQSGTKVVSARLRRNAGSIITSFTITVNIVNTNDITVDPAALTFTQLKHLSETKSAIVKLINPGAVDFTISYPAFLNVDPNSGNSSVDLDIETENSSVLASQKYTGDIEISYASKLIKIPVILNNVDFIDLDLSDYNFCLDEIMLTVQKMTDTGKFVRVGLQINIESADEMLSVNPVYQIAFFESEAKTDIGKKIQNYFPMFSKHIFEKTNVEFNNVFVTKPANVTITIDELNANYEVTFTRTIENIKFYPGRKPKMFPLFTNSAIKRIYSNSAHVFTYLTTLVEPSEIVGKTVSTNPFNSGEINSVFFEDSDDLMSFEQYTEVFGIDFLKMPKGDRQIFVQFINQNLVPEMAVFNGFYQIENDYSHTYDDFEINAKKYDTKVVGKMTLNTGFVFKEESSMIEEIAKSMLSFIKIAGKIYKCLPIPGKMTAVNSEENLVSFELEFLIVK